MSDSSLRKKISAFLIIYALDYLLFSMLSGNWFQIFGPMYLKDCLNAVFLHDMDIIWELLLLITLDVFV